MRTLKAAAAVFVTVMLFPALPRHAVSEGTAAAESKAEIPGYYISFKFPPGFSPAKVSTTEIETAAGVKTQKTYLSEGEDAVIILSVIDTGFTEESEESMIEALEYSMLEYSFASSVLSTGQRRINGNLFLTGRYTFAENNTDLYVDLFVTHIDTKQFQIQLLGYTPERLDKPDLRESVDSFTYLVKTR